jgi:predicted outer membrane repeat protein
MSLKSLPWNSKGTRINSAQIDRGEGADLNRNAKVIVSTSTLPRLHVHRMHNLLFDRPGLRRSAGGAIYDYYDAKPTIADCTFYGNSVVTSGKGGAIYGKTTSPATVVNTILWADVGGEIGADGTSASLVTYSDVDGGYSGTENINSDPLFVNPTTGGGGGGADGLELQAGSPCIDAGSDSAIPSGIATDDAGNQRIIDGLVDIGAFEYP